MSDVHPHGWIPDLLIDHDAPVCEVCHEGMDAHDGEALITVEMFRLRDALERIADYMGKEAIVSKLRFSDAATFAKHVLDHPMTAILSPSGDNP